MENEVLYRKRECALCGAYAFEKHLGTAKVLDGGFTKIEAWERSGFGTMVVVPHEFKHLDRIDLGLCSLCGEKLHKAICDAIEEIKRGEENAAD